MIITQTPLRLSLLGGNTDFSTYFDDYGGACLTATIDKYIYCIVKKRFDDEIWINYSEKEKVTNVADIKHDLAREALKHVGVDRGIEITFLSDIPSEGSGLGSSSALVVGLLNALYNYIGEPVGNERLAEQACHIEIEELKKPIGYQDQYAVALGGLNVLEFSDTSIEATPLKLPAMADHFLLVYTGMTRKADEILSKMILDTNILDMIKSQVYTGMGALSDPATFGTLLSEYWIMKKGLNPLVSTSELDEIYQRAMENGAMGGKLVGAGGGGFFLFVVAPSHRNVLKKALGLRELPIRLSRFGSRVIFNIQ